MFSLLTTSAKLLSAMGAELLRRKLDEMTEEKKDNSEMQKYGKKKNMRGSRRKKNKNEKGVGIKKNLPENSSPSPKQNVFF